MTGKMLLNQTAKDLNDLIRRYGGDGYHNELRERVAKRILGRLRRFLEKRR